MHLPCVRRVLTPALREARDAFAQFSRLIVCPCYFAAATAIAWPQRMRVGAG
jgi:hypothetical protein